MAALFQRTCWWLFAPEVERYYGSILRDMKGVGMPTFEQARREFHASELRRLAHNIRGFN